MPSQYQLDMNYMAKHKSEDVYSSFNLIMRRKPKENNFKAVLESIRDLMNEEVRLSLDSYWTNAPSHSPISKGVSTWQTGNHICLTYNTSGPALPSLTVTTFAHPACPPPYPFTR